MFDKGFWSVVWDGAGEPGGDNGDWKVIALTNEAIEYHGMRLRWPQGEMLPGVQWRDYFPSPALFQFHLECSVFRHCKGGAEPSEDEEQEGLDEDVEALRVLDTEENFVAWFNSSTAAKFDRLSTRKLQVSSSFAEGKSEFGAASAALA
ncbi:hypothetical protein HDV05_006343 [Chytridiales sp. JEL 0842]|nr:hypothetical protein HDV05_006343 [Chytridiales sp. JEL 0842]